jgi:short-subunit dehydrogenase
MKPFRTWGGPPAALAVNAGVGMSGEFTENDLATELRLLNLNITSAVHLTPRPHRRSLLPARCVSRTL